MTGFLEILTTLIAAAAGAAGALVVVWFTRQMDAKDRKRAAQKELERKATTLDLEISQVRALISLKTPVLKVARDRAREGAFAAVQPIPPFPRLCYDAYILDVMSKLSFPVAQGLHLAHSLAQTVDDFLADGISQYWRGGHPDISAERRLEMLAEQCEAMLQYCEMLESTIDRATAQADKAEETNGGGKGDDGSVETPDPATP